MKRTKTIRWAGPCLLLVLAAAALVLAACGGGTLPRMEIEVRDGVTTYNGTERLTFRAAEGEERELHIAVSRRSGSLSVSVLQTESREYAYRGTDLPTSDFFVLLPEPGEYCVEICADGFQGSYAVSDRTETPEGE